MTRGSTEDLFAAARDDAPPSAMHDAVWDRVVDTTTAPAPVSSAARAAVPVGGTKLLALSMVVSGVAVSALLLGVAPGEPPSPHRVPSVVASGHAAGARLSDPGPRGRAPEIAAPPAPAIVAATGAPPTGLPEESSLAEEARLVTQARAALVRGEPERALVLVRSAQRLAVRSLEPEELGVEARALRALGHTDAALATELTLKSRFPDHALAR